MNRQTILASVHRQLRESLAETGEVRPLGEIVPRVASEIRGTISDFSSTSAGVIPIEKVAAFVDGQLDAAEAEMICQAVMVDNSVLAEVIAAVRATQESIEQLPPLSTSLTAQLLALRSTMPVQPPQQNRTADELPSIRLEAAARPEDDRRSHARGLAIAAFVLAVAASIVAMVLLGRRDGPLPKQEMVVDNRADQVRPAAPPPGTAPELVPETPVPILQDPPEAIAQTRPPGVDQAAPREATAEDAKSQPIVAVAPTVPSSAVEPGEKTPPPPPDLDPRVDSRPVRVANPGPQLADLRWTEVSGLLAQQSQPGDNSASRLGPTWKRIQAGSQSASAPAQRVSFRTLPFSRASGELGTGGQVVIAGDTALQITRGDDSRSADVDLMYGALAMIDVAEGTVVNFHHGGQTMATLRWQDKASAVVMRQAMALQIQVEGGEIAINDQPIRSESVRVAGDAKTIDRIRAPKRLPRWVTRPDETTASDRLILAQIAETNDLTGAINQQIRALASSPTLRREDGRMLAKLASWQAAMAGPAVFRLAASRVPAVRLAAMNRLVQLSETDPRYQRTWNSVDRAVNNAQRSAQMQAWFRLVRAGARPSAAQLEQMLGGLSARDFSSRAISDFLLRRFVRNPPPFDPSWTGPTLQRAINVYRERAGLSNRLRPNAAATGIRP